MYKRLPVVLLVGYGIKNALYIPILYFMVARSFFIGAVSVLMICTSCAGPQQDPLVSQPMDAPEKMQVYRISIVNPFVQDAEVIMDEYKTVINDELGKVNSGLAEKNAKMEFVYGKKRCPTGDNIIGFQELTGGENWEVIFGMCPDDQLAKKDRSNTMPAVEAVGMLAGKVMESL